MAISLGILTQHFQTNPCLVSPTPAISPAFVFSKRNWSRLALAEFGYPATRPMFWTGCSWTLEASTFTTGGIWLVVSTPLKNISQWEGLSHILWKNKKCSKSPTRDLIMDAHSRKIWHSLIFWLKFSHIPICQGYIQSLVGSCWRSMVFESSWD